MDSAVGFIGLGNMGLPIATNLVKAGFKVTAYNRSKAKGQALAALGVRITDRAEDVIETGGIVVTMLSNDQVTEEIMLANPEICRRLAPSGIYLNLSTISPELALRLNDHFTAGGAQYVGAVVFGRPDRAQSAKLAVAVSGQTAAKERVNPILTAIGESLYDFGERPEAANTVKLAGNFLIASAIEALGEAMAFAEKNGIDRAQFGQLATTSLFACPAYQAYAPIIAAHKYEPAGFQLKLGMKDIDLLLKTAQAASVPMPIASLLKDRFLSAVAKGRIDWDWSSIGLQSAEDAGLNAQPRPAKNLTTTKI